MDKNANNRKRRGKRIRYSWLIVRSSPKCRCDEKDQAESQSHLSTSSFWHTKKQKRKCNEMDTAGPKILILSKPEMLATVISLFLHKCLKDVTIYLKYITEVQINRSKVVINRSKNYSSLGEVQPFFFFFSEKSRELVKSLFEY